MFLCGMHKTSRSDQRDRLFYYCSRLVPDGKAEGLTEGKTEVAKAFPDIRMAAEQIVSVTGLTTEQVEKLRWWWDEMAMLR